MSPNFVPHLFFLSKVFAASIVNLLHTPSPGGYILLHLNMNLDVTRAQTFLEISLDST